MTITVQYLREIANRILNETEGYADNDVVETSCNNYGMSTPYIATYNGFVSIDRMEIWDAEDYQ